MPKLRVRRQVDVSDGAVRCVGQETQLCQHAYVDSLDSGTSRLWTITVESPPFTRSSLGKFSFLCLAIAPRQGPSATLEQWPIACGRASPGFGPVVVFAWLKRS